MDNVFIDFLVTDLWKSLAGNHGFARHSLNSSDVLHRGPFSIMMLELQCKIKWWGLEWK